MAPVSDQPLSILFVREMSAIDGTLTLIARLAREATRDGHRATVLFRDRDLAAGIAALFNGTADIIFVDELPTLAAAGRLPWVDVIHAFASGDMLLRLYGDIRPRFFPGAPIVLGIYHPRAYFAETRLGATPDTRLFARFFRQVPPRNLLFMNEAVRRAHADYFGIDFTGSHILPLPVEVPPVYVARCGVDRRKVVSVGRLVEFKNYHAGVIAALAALNPTLSKPLGYHIYGDGPLRAPLEAQVRALGVDFVRFHGEVGYADLRVAMADALLVVAMGTTVIEASAQGVPALQAIESSTDRSYGWFFDQMGYEVGERLPGKPEQSYATLLAAAVNADPATYAAMEHASWRRAGDFAIEGHMADYYAFLRGADPDFSFRLPPVLWKALRLARQPYKLRVLQLAGHRHR